MYLFKSTLDPNVAADTELRLELRLSNLKVKLEADVCLQEDKKAIELASVPANVSRWKPTHPK